MKKIFLFLLLLLAASNAFAQKKYVNVVAVKAQYGNAEISVTGDVPSGFYSSGNIGDVLNRLAKSGFVVEQMSCSHYDNYNYVTEVVILSKSASTSGLEEIQHVYESEGDVTEVARYNLQGLPITENEKGIQIVVYSNYTTKTIIVE